MKWVSLFSSILLLSCSSGESELADAGETTLLESGLIITHVSEGTGPSPGPRDTVLVNYRGTLEDGSVFDSSADSGQPGSFVLHRVIPCWSEGLALMKTGGKAKLVCPPPLAYGVGGRPPKIPPNSTLYFDVELLDVL